MVSRWRITSLIGLCLVSTLACGFSTWIWTENGKADVGGIDVSVGDIQTNSSATILFQDAKLFTFGKYGFAHEEEIMIDSRKQTITYFDYSYSISSIWKVSTKDTTSFKHEINETYNGSFDFLPASGSFSVQSYSDYDASTGTLKNPISGASAKNGGSTSASITYMLTLPSSDSYQYLELVYTNTVSIAADSSFDAAVFTPATTQKDGHNNVMVVTFSFLLNKVGA